MQLCFMLFFMTRPKTRLYSISVQFLQELKCFAGGSTAGLCSRRSREPDGPTVLIDTGISFTTQGATAQAQSGGGGTIQRPRTKTI